MPDYVMLVVVLLFAVSFDFINGFHDTANSIATSVSTRVLSPRAAIVMSATLNFVGAMTSEKVASTISKGIVKTPVEQYVIVAALAGAICWNLITWYFGIPSSSSHALIGSLIGSAIVYTWSLGNIDWDHVFHLVVLPMLTSPVIGFLIGYAVMKLLYKILAFCTERMVTRLFSKLQILSASLMAYSHGCNDAQKSMGIITLALISAKVLPANSGVPVWVKIVCALSMACGTSIGGWKIIKTIGVNMIRLQPVGGFAAETSAACVIETMTHFGAPVSTTHVITTAIMGVGASKRFSAVRWALARSIVAAWVFTLPVTMIFGAVITFIIQRFI